MSLIRAFAGLRPVDGRAGDVCAPPYDVLNSAEARSRAEGRPYSFLHISKPEIDLPEDTNPYAPEVYAKAAENFQRMRQEGVLVQDEQPCYYIYRLHMDDHTQTGLVAVASVEDYDSNRIRKHEFTRPDKEDDRVRQIDALDAQTGPVLLAYRSEAEVDALLEAGASGAPDVDIVADDGIGHKLWVVRDQKLIDDITARFDAMPNLYIADGHHRSASASRVAAARREANPNHTGEEPYNYFLSVIFPHEQMAIFDYNRVVKDLNGKSPEEFMDTVGKAFEVAPSEVPVKPAGPAEFGMYLGGKWYRLNIREDLIPKDDPVKRLDVSLLADNLLDPVLGITDPRRDSRIDFVGGIRGLDGLQKRVDSGEMVVAFSMYPTPMSELMAVADAGEVMPPKSTWFEPKLADGLVSHLLESR
ncbi:uncharacterized protein FOKN1_1214 [Thiohalobacter thiocyanaticus]|uniref:DUF1015 domain-containing protein n=1 Tax=Thiohalobacter thiocyanaticus TaxID=585455 RepID=A0A1Z4VQ55_9GAMM|nr:DUF1015 family protein [Thiohalobacter thiocyanaticus]BAZ93613.1 uncharacterized protein FOKN1_1214 [Thiohalobacter thiocyanaticus]